MALPLLPAALQDLLLLLRRPLLRYAAAWTVLMVAAVAVTSFAPELAFVWAIRPSSSFARACRGAAVAQGGLARIPLEGPTWEVVCVPAQLLRRSRADFVVPPLFAALVVGGATWLVRAAGLWESEADDLETV